MVNWNQIKPHSIYYIKPTKQSFSLDTRGKRKHKSFDDALEDFFIDTDDDESDY